ncbi:DUF4245 domain-containing protein [Citricoccus sp. SGAir0253]|uniref:DUF4245 domain-containing protein n=1 Tax=Citricoccus sp. SGAir0253 TaxID=2567881 RepID=UPI0010CD062B|nr:DUF4245 domain-containing protein [Citricoccus sp. SGAir0253]QCU78650.1 DUF4245 domain-containing protein [Citricoccus sp. SGAir0253]
MTSPEPAPSSAPKPRLTQKQVTRASQSAGPMVISVLATLALALLVVFINPGSTDRTYRPDVDVPTVARQATATAGFRAVAPEVPEGWTANYARWNAAGSDRVESWEAGYVTPEEDFAGFTQTAQANPTWLSQQMDNAPRTGTRSVDGTTWELHEPRDGDRHMVAELGGTTVIVTGSGDLGVMDTLASAIQKDLQED